MHTHGSSVAVAGPRMRRRRRRRSITGRIVWSGTLRVLQRIARYKRGERQEFQIGFSVRDLLTDKSRAVRDQMEVFVQAVQKAGSYQAKEEAARAVRAVLDALKDRVPPDVLLKLSESLPVREAARLRRAATQRLQRDDGRGGKGRGARRNASSRRRLTAGRHAASGGSAAGGSGGSGY